MKQLKHRETIECQQTYVDDKQQLFSRIIFHRLTEEQLQKRQKKIAEKEKNKNRIYSEKSNIVAGLNVYVTIAIFLCSSTMFKMHQLLLQKNKKN